MPSFLIDTGAVENTALSPDEEHVPRAACCGTCGGIWTTLSRDPWVYHLATLRHFDHKLPGTALLGPLIPCERRLAIMEISEFQEVNSWT